MPNPHNVHALKDFTNEEERDAYAEGLQQGINFEYRPGSDPSRVRKEEDLFRSPKKFYAFIESGMYDDDGGINWG